MRGCGLPCATMTGQSWCRAGVSAGKDASLEQTETHVNKGTQPGMLLTRPALLIRGLSIRGCPCLWMLSLWLEGKFGRPSAAQPRSSF